MTPLHYAFENLNVAAVKALVENGANCRSLAGYEIDKIAPIHMAAGAFVKDVVPLASSKWTDRAKGIKKTDDVVIEILPSISKADESPKRKEIIEILINHGANVNRQGVNNWTPLHWACVKGLKDTAQYLISKGANKNLKDYKQKKPEELIKKK